MRKCPRCQHDVQNHDKFCPNCGLDLSASLPKTQKKDGPMSNIKRIIFLVIILSIPFLYTTLFSGDGGVSNILTQQETLELGEYTNKDAIMISGSFDNLADFNAKYTNVSQYVNGIMKYEDTLALDNNVYNKEYIILVLDNNEIVFHLEYTSRIDENHELTIVREFNRTHTYNKQEVIMKKENNSTFEELLFDDKEIAFVSHYTDKDTYVASAVNEFSLRYDEFIEKKDTLGHFGIGTYHDNASFVVKKYGEVYTSIYTQYEVVNDYIC